MNQNGGLGKVIRKNKFIYNGSLSEQMTAVKHVMDEITGYMPWE